MSDVDEATLNAASRRHAAQMRPIAPTLEDVFVTLTRATHRRSAESLRRYAARGVADQQTHTSRSATPHATDRSKAPVRTDPLAGFLAILIKEFVHIRRQPSTLFFMLVIPVIQTLIFGYAIEHADRQHPHGRVTTSTDGSIAAN